MKKMLKSLIAMLLLLALVFTFVACDVNTGNNTGNGNGNGNGGNEEVELSAESFNDACNKNINAITEGIGQYYDNLNKFNPGNMSFDGDFSVKLSDELLSFLSELTKYDLAWVNNLKIKVSETMDGNAFSYVLGLTYGATDLATVQAIFNLAKGELFIGIPELSDKFLDMSARLDMTPVQSMGSIDVTALIPEEEALVGLIKEIYDTFMANIGEATFEEGKLTVDGVEENCGIYTVKLTQKEVAKVFAEILKKLQTSNNFKTIVCDFVESYTELAADMGASSIGVTPEEAHEELVEELEDAICQLENEINATDDVALIWTSYINSKLQVIGTKMEFVDETDKAVLYSATATNNGKSAQDFYIETKGTKVVELKGNLTKADNKISGTYELIVEGKSMLYVDLENVDAAKYESGSFVGSISISPSKDLLDMIGASDVDLSAAGLTLSAISLKIDVESTEANAVKMTLSIMNAKVPYVSFVVNGKISEGKDITVPGNTVNNPETWLSGFNFDKLLENVEKSGLPDYIVELFEMALQPQ